MQQINTIIILFLSNRPSECLSRLIQKRATRIRNEAVAAVTEWIIHLFVTHSIDDELGEIRRFIVAQHLDTVFVLDTDAFDMAT